ncbi:VOC family protein [Gillisia sp. Q332]|uniref:VOC family protein n=1 Tax=Gillisia xinjiangensis TaxID=3384765 RepID=UPI00391B9DC5
MKIKELEISTSRLLKQLRFYRDTLGLVIKNEEEDSFQVSLGYSVLKFQESEDATPYHIAFHIPDRQEHLALKWLKSRVEILKNNEDEIIDFSGWNAKSIYFYDVDFNILELISRKDFNKPESPDFSEKNILGIAEVGLATAFIEEKYQFLHQKCGLKVFDGNFKNFCAIGDDKGLLITIDKNLKDWFPTGDEAFGSDFRIKFEHQDKNYEVTFSHDRLEMVKK